MFGGDRVDRRQVSDIPTLPAYEAFLNESTYWLVWCDHCREWHRHGPMNGHREAHCSDETSLYSTSGYNPITDRTLGVHPARLLARSPFGVLLISATMLGSVVPK
jgi:hypothetical protein